MFIMIKRLSICLGIIVLSACAVEKPATGHQKTLLQVASSLKTKLICEEKGGMWKKVGKLQSFSCVLTAGDSGAACTDSSQCQIGCVWSGKTVPAGTEVTGQCAATTNLFGCHTRVSNGRAEHTLCID
ncbi:hypothetical protein M3P05_18190 [Sansalvadorimonas sp. 2012CJ34-2]|uniref:Lipoprotein n=1 Tax=Parendozoicomonas callyspongiae TaxID=2942213 RepID=A0ABT0PKQ7_9GAMM|nr:hypothetical protein [Sansalvadorimonas sp. 2012CJ34-2]MCL6271851.1 hypothetical protein [Sansalvadorimonas sp. 2012CJ34-2]